MGVIYILIIVSLFVAIIFLAVFFLAVKNGQFEDHETPAMRILFNDTLSVQKKENKTETIIE
ncbi:cbb3-type cytochrome oxidase assembly protein CcoS [Wenyingzhuangia sp. 2_MG-2023]|uniref:cbb3-type cytochrome oxidase assembly protein CcoS n=1 Tax=Wenyingzhuangia sp. 2_MG-2023 TaxID=3062639 RepID=UPI0026E3C378|nr:cbb3-type cytochrome oxidase assembly protein CcoS [Wenyingzhuangia sp. 2_MG-2023]MDO6738956.1 cbb3-type cytochrome oxidase assembly protein CcoS [Wenyingzhuangia sp. 2_MG-2023]MDO6803708.1 cbb3-type cytochrome oxidase assembly protein CcoS [Wenyingzhuangia sp. 1_MG-2023]